MNTQNIIDYISGNISDPEETKAIQEWIFQDSRNKREYIHLKNVYVLSRNQSSTINTEIEYRKLQNKLNPSGRKVVSLLLRYAAILIIAFGLGYFAQRDSWLNYESSENYLNEVVCPEGQISEVYLSDGTKVWLNSGSKISYPTYFGEKARAVELVGEAFFEVKKDPAHPFLVKARNMTVRVLGTSFNVDAYEESSFIRTTLVEGKVELLNDQGGTMAILSPGQSAQFNSQNQNVNLSNVDTRFYFSWKEGKISFFNETLESIAIKLEHWYNVRISFEEEGIKSYRFTGTILKYKPLEQILQVMKLSSPIDYEVKVQAEDKNEIILSKQN